MCSMMLTAAAGREILFVSDDGSKLSLGKESCQSSKIASARIERFLNVLKNPPRIRLIRPKLPMPSEMNKSKTRSGNGSDERV